MVLKILVLIYGFLLYVKRSLIYGNTNCLNSDKIDIRAINKENGQAFDINSAYNSQEVEN